MKSLLVGVVEHGTGQRARIEGVRVAGKTGTAQKAVRGGYSRTDYIASFVGFAPADVPELTALVILDSPDGDHSGSRAAAVFARIVARSLRYLGAPSDAGVPPVRVARIWPQSRPIISIGAAGTTGEAATVARNERFGARRVWAPEPGDRMDGRRRSEHGVPDVLGFPARDAVARFVSRGIVPEIIGAGWVIEQYPGAGMLVEPGTRARLVLATLDQEPVAPLEPRKPMKDVPMLRPNDAVQVAEHGEHPPPSEPRRRETSPERWQEAVAPSIRARNARLERNEIVDRHR